MKKVILFLTLTILAASVFLFFKNLNVQEDKILYTKIDAVDFEKIKTSKVPMVIYFGKESCHACRKFTPILNEAINVTKNENVFYLDCDNLQNRDIAKLYDVNETPTLISFNPTGQKKYIGVQNLDKTIEILNQ